MAVPRHTLRMGRLGADAEPVRALSFIAGRPLPSGEALLAFGGQPADKPDALTLLPLSPSTVGRAICSCMLQGENCNKWKLLMIL